MLLEEMVKFKLCCIAAFCSSKFRRHFFGNYVLAILPSFIVSFFLLSFYLSFFCYFFCFLLIVVLSFYYALIIEFSLFAARYTLLGHTVWFYLTIQYDVSFQIYTVVLFIFGIVSQLSTNTLYMELIWLLFTSFCSFFAYQLLQVLRHLYGA